MKMFNKFALHIKCRTKLEAVNYCIEKGLEEGLRTFIDDEEIHMVKARKVTDKETILINGRISNNHNYVFRYLQAEFNLNQRQLLYIIIGRISGRNGFEIG
ncbi:hypothetical protein ACTHQ8_16625 [Lysinibacillus odysseyi]|uniref:Uncharacterized protein n=2 Tax=Lysinibacillus odysseyi TaxID=202611 RepID=A0A0A3IUF6_9BACI|nr:hypothetical protein CD32_01595 [Lysinibacillus odysseyi 34hs-1 = NBRC 100172]